MTLPDAGPSEAHERQREDEDGKGLEDVGAAHDGFAHDRRQIPRPPAKKPEITPRTTPPTKATAVEDTRAMVRSMRGAAITRENMSMPEMSVPIQWSTLGGSIRCARQGRAPAHRADQVRPERGQEDCQRHDPEADEEPGAAAAKPGEMARLAGDGTQDADCHAGDAGAEPTGASGSDRERAEAGRLPRPTNRSASR